MKSLKMGYRGHVVKEVIQGCTSGSIEVAVDNEYDGQMTSVNGLTWKSMTQQEWSKIR